MWCIGIWKWGPLGSWAWRNIGRRDTMVERTLRYKFLKYLAIGR